MDVISSLVKARLDWSEDGTADHGLKEFFRAASMFEARRDISFVPAVTVLNRTLVTETSRPCNADLFDQFVSFLLVANNPSHATLDAAQLPLYHPRRADPYPYFKRRRNECEAFDRRFWPRQRKSVAAMGKHDLRAAFLLRLQGHCTDTDWYVSHSEYCF